MRNLVVNIVVLHTLFLLPIAAQAWQFSHAEKATFQQECETVMASLASHDDPQSTRQLFDLLMKADVEGLGDTANRLKRCLLVQRPESLQARYLVSTFNDANVLKNLLKEEFQLHESDLEPVFCRQYCLAVELGMRKFNAAMLQGNDFLLQTALAADISRNLALSMQCREKLKTCDDQTVLEIDRIAFDRSLSARQRFIDLQPHHENRQSRMMQSYLYKSLSESVRTEPQVRMILAENYLYDMRNTDAISQIDHLLIDAAPNLKTQLLFWKAIALNRTAQTAAAIESLQQAVSQDFDTPWAESARTLLPALENQESTIIEYADLFGRAIAVFRESNCERFEIVMHVKMDKNSESKKSCIVSLDTADSIVQIQLLQNDISKLIYEADRDRAKLYLDGDQQIHLFEKPMFPLVNLDVRTAEGKYQWLFNAGVSTEAGTAKNSLLAFLASPVISTPVGRAAMVKYEISRGMILLKPEIVEGKYRLVSLSPRIGTPGFDKTETLLNEQHKLTHFHNNWLVVEKLQYGSSDNFELAQLAFPDLEKVAHQQFDAITFSKVLGAAMQFFADQGSPQAPAAQSTSKSADQSAGKAADATIEAKTR